MSVDTSKIRPGDTGTIKVRFESLACDIVKVVFSPAGIGPDASHWMPVNAIASHTPAPWVPEPTDVVGWKPTGSTEWQVVAVENGFAWIRRAGPHWGGSHSVAPLAELTFLHSGSEPKPRLDAYPRCSRRLAANGMIYPRTCAECGLGPCKLDLPPLPPPEDQA